MKHPVISHPQSSEDQTSFDSTVLFCFFVPRDGNKTSLNVSRYRCISGIWSQTIQAGRTILLAISPPLDSTDASGTAASPYWFSVLLIFIVRGLWQKANQPVLLSCHISQAKQECDWSVSGVVQYEVLCPTSCPADQQMSRFCCAAL